MATKTHRIEIEETPELRLRITAFFQLSLNDKDLLYNLKYEGYSLGIWDLIRIRKKLGFIR